jgi:hypothetical protein
VAIAIVHLSEFLRAATMLAGRTHDLCPGLVE